MKNKKVKKDPLVLDADNCVSNALDFLIEIKGEETKIKSRIVEYNLQLHPHSGIGFDTWIILINLPCDENIVDIMKKMEKVQVL